MSMSSGAHQHHLLGSCTVVQSPPKANYVHVEHWKAEVEGDVGAFAYPSLRQQEAEVHGATPTTASSLRWTKEEQRRTVTVNNVATDFVDRMELGERCLCTSPVKRQGYVRQRNQAGCTGDRNLLHYPPAMPPATLDQYDKLLSAPTPQQRRATAAAAAAKSMMASPRPTFFTDQERGRIQLRSAASTDSAAAACLGTLGTHDSLAIDVWRRRHRDRRTKHQLRSLRDAGPSVSVPNLVSVRERALVQAAGLERRREFFSAYRAMTKQSDKVNRPGQEACDSSDVRAQRHFLHAAVKGGVVPEPLFARRSGEHRERLSLRHFALSDALAHALADGLNEADGVREIDLCGNLLGQRATASLLRSLVRRKELTSLDLSYNSIDLASLQLLEPLLCGSLCTLTSLTLSHTKLNDSVVTQLTRLLRQENSLIELDLSHNAIGSPGAHAVSEMLAHPSCQLTALDMSWNAIMGDGAQQLADVLRYNTRLVRLALAFNDLSTAAEFIADGLSDNRTLVDLDISHCRVPGEAAVIFARALRLHGVEGKNALRRLALNGNPLGAAGFGALLRFVCGGSAHAATVSVELQDCRLQVGDGVFDSAEPGAGNPYSLDMTRPYSRAVVHELLELVMDGGGCALNDVVAVQQRKRSKLGAVDDKSTANSFNVPEIGALEFTVTPEHLAPSAAKALNADQLAHVMQLLGDEESVPRCAALLTCLSHAFGFSTAQVRVLLQNLRTTDTVPLDKTVRRPRCKKIPLEPLDVIARVFLHLSDTENVFKFVCENLRPKHVASLITRVGSEQYKCNTTNLSGRWTLDLSRASHRGVLGVVAAKNEEQCSDAKANADSQQDASQKRDWASFRNASLDGEPTTLNPAFFKRAEQTGILVFDFVTPPPLSSSQCNTELSTKELLRSIGFEVNRKGKERCVMPLPLFLLHFHRMVSEYFFTCEQVVEFIDKFDQTFAKVAIAVSCFARVTDPENFGHMLFKVLTRTAFLDVVSRLGWLHVWNEAHPFMRYELDMAQKDERELMKRLGKMAKARGDVLLEDDEMSERTVPTSGTMPSDGCVVFDYMSKEAFDEVKAAKEAAELDEAAHIETQDLIAEQEAKDAELRLQTAK